MFQKKYLLLLLVPSLALAAPVTVSGVVDFLITFFNEVMIWLVFSFTILFFFIQLTLFLWNKKNGKSIKDQRNYMIYALVALTIMFTFYAIVYLFAETFGIKAEVGVPQFFKGGIKSGTQQKSNIEYQGLLP
jgi:uncharacterized membrane protein